MENQTTQRERRRAQARGEESQPQLEEQSAGDPVAGGGNGVVLQGDPGGEYSDFISEPVYLICQKAAGTLAVMGGNGVVLIENQAGKSIIKST